MAKTVILSVHDGSWDKWGKQFVARQPLNRQQNLMSAKPTVAEAKTAILSAAAAAGPGGTLVISVGHGGSEAGNALEGMVDLAPGKVLRLAGANAAPGSCFVSVFYDVNIAGPPSMSDKDYDTANNPNSQRLKNWNIYKEIADGISVTGLYQVVFLTCRVGNATEFVRKIANDWNVVCLAYTARVVGLFSSNPKERAQLTLETHPIAQAADAETVMLSEEELPYFPLETVRIGPPLPTH